MDKLRMIKKVATCVDCLLFVYINDRLLSTKRKKQRFCV